MRTRGDRREIVLGSGGWTGLKLLEERRRVHVKGVLLYHAAVDAERVCSERVHDDRSRERRQIIPAMDRDVVPFGHVSVAHRFPALPTGTFAPPQSLDHQAVHSDPDLPFYKQVNLLNEKFLRVSPRFLGHLASYPLGRSCQLAQRTAVRNGRSMASPRTPITIINAITDA